MMKKTLIFFAGVLLAIVASCDREPCSLCTEDVQLRHVHVGLSGIPVQTRAEGVTEAQESAVNSCVLLIFDRNGNLVNSFESGTGTFDFYLTDATYDFVAVVNKAQISSGLSKRELMTLETTLAENSVGNFVMAGSLDNHVIQEDEKLTVQVKRVVSKYSYKIRTAFVGSLASKQFSVDEIYLTNVPGVSNLGNTYQATASDKWFNKMNFELEEGMPEGLLYGRIGKSMAATDSIWTGHAFYSYPNSSPDNHDKDVWSVRCTRFVVKATLDGRTTYYPVTIPKAESNKHYHIDITISNYGVDHPEDIPGNSDYVEVYVTVADWEDGGEIHGEY